MKYDRHTDDNIKKYCILTSMNNIKSLTERVKSFKSKDADSKNNEMFADGSFVIFKTDKSVSALHVSHLFRRGQGIKIYSIITKKIH